MLKYFDYVFYLGKPILPALTKKGHNENLSNHFFFKKFFEILNILKKKKNFFINLIFFKLKLKPTYHPNYFLK